MRPASEARLGLTALLSLQLLTSVGGVVLLGRMAPAVERIIEENVYSTEAVEDMLGALASGAPAATFDEALARARGNITEAGEVELIGTIDGAWARARAGDAAARGELVEALHDLGRLNRASMVEADTIARNLGLAGAWAMALLGFLGFLVSLVVSRRVQDRLLVPFGEVDRVLAAARAGDQHRRCVPTGAPAAEQRVMENLDWLLDQRGARADAPTEDPLLRACLLALLDRESTRAQVLVGPQGAVVAVNSAALAAGSEPDQAPAVIARRIAQGEPAEGWQVERLAAQVWLATRAGAR